MSSDSEDDCYGNVAQKLQSIKRKFEEDKIQTTSLIDSPLPENSKGVDKPIEIIDNSLNNAGDISKDDSDCEEISLDTIIAQNMKKRGTRKSKRNSIKADISTDNIITTDTRKRTRASKATASAIVDLDSSQNVSDSNESITRTTKRGRGRQRGRKSVPNSSTRNNVTNNTNPPPNPSVNRTTNRNTARRPRGSHRGQVTLPQFMSAMFGLSSHNHPIFSVGNTDEYPDESQNQPLFTNQPKEKEVVIIENEHEFNDSLDENEELSVKVYWQNRECIKFNIRRFQKLQSVFDFFAKREKVSHDKLFFTYNDKIIKADDTPDSITYNIAKFIDGGVTNQSILNIIHKDIKKDGLKLKFQCQNVKKPYEIYIKADDKLAMAMLQYAEHLEQPLEKLKFFFDGDLITGKNTPKELDLEGGECIDVKIIS